MENLAEIERRAARIKLLLMDCDGVLTDGGLMLLENGDEQKTFNVRDGHGLVLLHRAGLQSGIISGRTSSLVTRRASELGMNLDLVSQGSWDKIKDFETLLAKAGVSDDEIAFVGDDVTDIPLMHRAEFAIAVADAVPETLAAAHYVTQARGGHGAIREVCEIILKAQGHWSRLMERYVGT
ncbi:MAG TPA: HAD hydrolase family protein [Pyrinomonadaceae bacterium]|nr:HAD hydrolase family protein [Pyrinomonadaceae bacterium]